MVRTATKLIHPTPVLPSGSLTVSDTTTQPPHSSHYRLLDPEPVDVIGWWDHLNFNLGSVIKYVARAGLKGDKRADLEKAAWYLARELKRLEGGE